LVSLGLYPDKPIRLVGLVKDVRRSHDPHRSRRVAKDDRERAGQGDRLEAGQRDHRIDRIVNSPKLERTLANIEKATGDIDRLVNRVDSQVEPLSADARRTMEEARVTLGEANKALASARGALAQAEKTSPSMKGSRAGRIQPAGDPFVGAGCLDESRKAIVECRGSPPRALLGYEVGTTLKR